MTPRRGSLRFCLASCPEAGRVSLGILLVVALVGLGLLTYLALSSKPNARTSPVPAAPPTTTADQARPAATARPPADPLARERSLLAAPQTNPPVQAHLSVLLDSSQSLPQRRKAARSLSQLGTAAAVAALKVAFYDGPRDSRPAVAEALAASRHPDAFSAAQELVERGEERIALAAISGLGYRGDPAAVDLLRGVLLSQERSETLRIEAAVSLGTIAGTDGGPQALQSLFDAAIQVRDEAVLQPVLEGIASRPFPEAEPLVKEYLGRANIPVEAKALALEALGRTGDAPPEFFLDYATNQEAKLRAAAALGLASGEPSALSGELAGVVRAESDPLVRSRLYQAIAHQENSSGDEVLGLVRSEKDPAARLAALALAGAVAASEGHQDLARYLNEVGVPELTQTALSSTNPEERLAAAVTLSRVNSSEAAAGIATIAGTTKDPRVLDVLRSAVEKQQRNP